MTFEKMIEILERRTTIPDSKTSWEEINEAIDKAISVLHTHKRLMNMLVYGDTWENCNACCANRFFGNTFCSRCGKPLTEDAWYELQRRIKKYNDD